MSAATLSAPAIKHIDERRLEEDLGYRFGYVSEFMGFGPEDVAAIHAMAPYLAPLVGVLVDAVYVKLFSYDATKRHFVPRQFGYDGPTPASLDGLGLDHEQIRYRKSHLGAYLKKLVTGAYDLKMVGYLDFVGKMHTPKAGSPEINVPLVQRAQPQPVRRQTKRAFTNTLDRLDYLHHVPEGDVLRFARQREAAVQPPLRMHQFAPAQPLHHLRQIRRRHAGCFGNLLRGPRRFALIGEINDRSQGIFDRLRNHHASLS